MLRFLILLFIVSMCFFTGCSNPVSDSASEKDTVCVVKDTLVNERYAYFEFYPQGEYYVVDENEWQIPVPDGFMWGGTILSGCDDSFHASINSGMSIRNGFLNISAGRADDCFIVLWVKL